MKVYKIFSIQDKCTFKVHLRAKKTKVWHSQPEKSTGSENAIRFKDWKYFHTNNPNIFGLGLHFHSILTRSIKTRSRYASGWQTKNNALKVLARSTLGHHNQKPLVNQSSTMDYEIYYYSSQKHIGLASSLPKLNVKDRNLSSPQCQTRAASFTDKRAI